MGQVPLPGSLHNDGATRHQGLFVGQGQGLPRLQGRKGGLQAHHAHHRVQGEVRSRPGGSFTQALHAGEHLDVRIPQALPQGKGRPLVEDGHHFWMELAGLLLQPIDAGAGGQGCNLPLLSLLPQVLHHLKGLGADRASRAQQR